MRIIRIKGNPWAVIVKHADFTQYYIKGKMLQIDKTGKTLVDTSNLKTIKKITTDIFKKGINSDR